MTDEKSAPANDDVIIEPPSEHLMKKAPLVNRSLETALKRTEDVVAQIGKSYPLRLANDCARLREMTAAFKQSLSPETKEDIRFLAHDMKGQGGQFGYGLVTAICDSLQTYLKAVETPVVRTAEVVGVHVDALSLIEAKKMTGSGGEAGNLLLDNLSKVVEKG